MINVHHTISLDTHGQGLYEFTHEVSSWVAAQHVTSGMLTVFCRHTSAALSIQENADPDVQHDLQAFFKALVREDPSLYRHNSEGPDDMPAHIKSALTDVSLSIPVIEGRMALGTWQGIYLFEYRAHDHRRSIILSFQGE